MLLPREPVRTTACQHEQEAWLYMKSHDLPPYTIALGRVACARESDGGGFETPKAMLPVIY